MSIDAGSFSEEIRNSSGFETFLDRVNASSFLKAHLEYYTNSSMGVFTASTAGTFAQGPTQINIAVGDLPVAGDEASITRFTSAVAHELGHVSLPGGMLTDDVLKAFYNAPDAGTAATIQLRQEGVASYFEYMSAQELGFPIRGGGALESTLNNLAATLGVGSGAFQAAAINESIKTYGALHPTTAPNVTYQEYYGDGWYLYKAGLKSSEQNWLNFASDTIQAQDIGNGVTRVTSTQMLKDGGIYTSSFSMDLNRSGEVVQQFKAIEAFDGFKYAQVFGQGSYYLGKH